MKSTWLAVGVLATAGVAALPVEARADVRVGVGILVGSDYRWGYADPYRIGYDNGLREGAEHGYRDGQRGRDFNFRHAAEYRYGEGYRAWMGPRSPYVAGFRRGYEQAYRRAYYEGRAHCERRGGHRDRYGDDDDRVIYEEPSGRPPYWRR